MSNLFDETQEIDMIIDRLEGYKDEADDLEDITDTYDLEDFRVDTDGIEDILNEEEKDKKKKTRRTVGKSFLLAGELVVIMVMSLALALLVIPNSKSMLVNSWLGRFVIKMVVSDSEYNNILDTNYDRDNMSANDGVNLEALEGYNNIALFGLDSRFDELDSGVRSDTIIVVSINEETKEVKMCSVYRDNYLRVVKNDGSSFYGKVNSAYAYGGPEAAVKTLNENFDLNITDYAAVNFYGIANIIDMLGGIDINISADEMYWINQYLTETRKVTGIYAPDVYSYGDVHLSGLQAVAFCRIRKVQFTDEDGAVYNNDFGRTARQRRIIMKLVDLAKNAGLSQVMDAANEVFYGSERLIYTSIPYDEILDLIPTLLNFSITDSTGYPYTFDTPEKVYTGDEVIKYPVCIAGLGYNNYKMHYFLFNDKNYKPSDTVKTIDSALYGILGYPEKRLDGDENINLD